MAGPERKSELYRVLAFEHDPDLRIEKDVLRDGLAAWEGARGARPMPARADLDPRRLPRRLLPHVLLVDVEHRPVLRFRWRLIGTHVTTAVGRDSTGRYLDDLYEPEILAAVTEPMRWTVANRRPLRVLGTGQLVGKDYLHSENLQMPLSSDGEGVDMILLVTVFRN